MMIKIASYLTKERWIGVCSQSKPKKIRGYWWIKCNDNITEITTGFYCSQLKKQTFKCLRDFLSKYSQEEIEDKIKNAIKILKKDRIEYPLNNIAGVLEG